jgi:glucosamine--fructose-6-phosphate aminotransferase (isomerizing)
MCGIVGYTGSKPCYPILIQGLRRLEYRGYDSAGVAVMNGTGLFVSKAAGKIDILASRLRDDPPSGSTGIAHTRWATHGEPSTRNAHPHGDCSGRVAVVHNGILENADALRTRLVDEGHSFQSDTDTEVLAHLIESCQSEGVHPVERAVALALRLVKGTFGIAVLSQDEPQKIVGARRGSPLVFGLGEGEFFIASDVSPLMDHTRDVIYLGEDEMAVATPEGFQLLSIHETPLEKSVEHVTWELAQIEKVGFDHFMEKEIFEQPQSIHNGLRGRILLDQGDVRLGGLNLTTDKILGIRRIILTGCGTSWHAALIGEYLLEGLARVPVEVDYASEFRYRDPILHPEDLVIAISQSGETADTLAALREAHARGSRVLGICNVVGSSIARESDGGIYIHAGPEIGVASTKAFTGQVAMLLLLSVYLGRIRGTLPKERAQRILGELQNLPDLMVETLTANHLMANLASEFTGHQNALYLGRGLNFPVALEGALKLKEISYVHAEGYPAAEMKHGPIALIDERMPVVFLATRDAGLDKVLSNMAEVRARSGRILAIVTKGDEDVVRDAEKVYSIPPCHPLIAPLLSVVPLQLLAYHVAVLRGCDIDQPRNLAKSVTVE